MSTIDDLNNQILTLQNENDPYKKQLTKLLRKQSTKQLTAEQKRELDVEIDKVDKRISANNQIILQKEKQITAEKETNNEKEKQITADKEKDAAIAKFRAERGETNSSPMSVIFFRW